MYLSLKATIFALAALASAEDAATTPGYDCPPNSITPSIPLSNTNLTFGQHYAVLNLDLINGLVSPIANTPQGSQFISNTARWISAVHSQNPAPLSIFTRIYYSNARKPELGPDTPFGKPEGPWERRRIPTRPSSRPSTRGRMRATWCCRRRDDDVRYVIANNTIETPPDTPGINEAILEGIIPKLPANVITIEQAMAALERSGPAVY
ncbi:Hypothetical predicted protein [Lecanosticta acicola]|uniref:Uncharacterized protein n=1 Tax=Lecanosticta acicola TaxID=111012 RepID=A0AAI8Z0X8_9PEZI|nr:Hypothetical predicted protein [Lecanosticta acicola]